MHLGLQPQGLAGENILIGLLKKLDTHDSTGCTTLRRTVLKEDTVKLLTCLKATAYNDT